MTLSPRNSILYSNTTSNSSSYNYNADNANNTMTTIGSVSRPTTILPPRTTKLKRTFLLMICMGGLGGALWMQLSEIIGGGSTTTSTTTNSASTMTGILVDRSSSSASSSSSSLSAATWDDDVKPSQFAMPSASIGTGEEGESDTTTTTTVTTSSSFIEKEDAIIAEPPSPSVAALKDDTGDDADAPLTMPISSSTNTTTTTTMKFTTVSAHDGQFNVATTTSDEALTGRTASSALPSSSSTSSSSGRTKAGKEDVEALKQQQQLDIDDDDDGDDTTNTNANDNYDDKVPLNNSTSTTTTTTTNNNNNNNLHPPTPDLLPPPPVVQQIILLGERHSGTTWITNYLSDCFDIKVSNEYTRYKHWYQSDDLLPEQSAVVIVLFRDPYDWVEAMRLEPHHAHDHLHRLPIYNPKRKKYSRSIPLEWKEFVTKPWIGRRGKQDESIRKHGNTHNATCMDNYSFFDAAPCSIMDSNYVEGLATYKYEYLPDGSERGYPSIIDLRRMKIEHMLSISQFRGTHSLFPFRYEDLNWNGTGVLLRSVEEATGLQAKCNATLGKSHHRQRQRQLKTKHTVLPADYIQWMNRFVDWEVEEKIGYSKRGGEEDLDDDDDDDDDAMIESEASLEVNVSPDPDVPDEQIILLGERHSGTNWITAYLTECFNITVSNDYKRFKHWFQEEDLKRVPERSAVVVALFRDPYDWVEAMRLYPHHAHDHLHWKRPITNASTPWQEVATPLDWKAFVTKPWIGRRGRMDKQIGESQKMKDSVICMDNYTYVDAAPCSEEDASFVTGLGQYKYEYQHDGSERGFSSIIDLRRDKIVNMFSVADFRGTRAFLPFRFEDLDVNGTSVLLRSVEEATGLKARCNATTGNAITTYSELPIDFIRWMNRYVDWDAEGRIGYVKRGL